MKCLQDDNYGKEMKFFLLVHTKSFYKKTLVHTAGLNRGWVSINEYTFFIDLFFISFDFVVLIFNNFYLITLFSMK